MADRTISITHRGVTYGGVMATIESTSLGLEDHGIVTAYLHCKWPGGGIGVGGFGLDTPVKDEEGRFSHREGTAYGLDHIMRLAQTVGVARWEQLPGKHVIVLFEGQGSWLGQTSVGIAHPTDDKKVLILKEHADEWRARTEPEAAVSA